MSLVDGNAHIGVWINHSKGKILGATLTLPNIYGTILQNVLVLLITLAGVHCWGLCCFGLHRLRTTARAKDGLHYQQQAILRGQMPSNDALWRLLCVAFAWRGNVKRPFRRTFGLLVIAFVNVSVFATASIFSSRLITKDNEVLARGSCGFLDGVNESTTTLTQRDRNISDVLYATAYTSFREASAYARSCYLRQVDKKKSLCDIYTVPFISSTRSTDIACPFQEDVCLDTPVQFDTGSMSSDSHFGINSRHENRVSMRRITTCAPINTTRYSSAWTSEELPDLTSQLDNIILNDTYKYFSLGPLVNAGDVYSNFVASQARLMIQDTAYQLEGMTYFPQPAGGQVEDISAFRPISDLERGDADTSLIILSNKAFYTTEVHDPWFAATQPRNTTFGLDNIYFPDNPISVVACREQFQFCNDELCSPLSGFATYKAETSPGINLNALQQVTYRNLVQYAEFMRLSLMLLFLRNEILLANQLVYGALSISSALPANQWKLEMENLHNIALAGMQSHALLHASPADLEIKPGVSVHDILVRETKQDNLEICGNQKFRSNLYASFSLLGLLLIILVSFTIICLNIILPTLVGWILGRTQGYVYSKQAWIDDDVLQLQRVALEGRGIGPWNGKDDFVPTLEECRYEFHREGLSFDGSHDHFTGESKTVGYVNVQEDIR